MPGFLRAVVDLNHHGIWLQIGSNVMDLNPAPNTASIVDPLAQFLHMFDKYEKLFIEPIPDNFQQLVQNCRSIPNSKPLQYAILPQPGPPTNVTMWCWPEELWYDWRKGACSFDRHIIDEEMGQDSAGKHAPHAVNVAAISVETLLHHHVPDLSALQVLLIDVEGFDAKVVHQLPFNEAAFRPKLIVWDNVHLAPEEPAALQDLLHKHCYAVVAQHDNTYAIAL